jgi:hypothetical protein
MLKKSDISDLPNAFEAILSVIAITKITVKARILTIVLFFALIPFSHVSTASSHIPKLQGGYVQFQDWMMNLSAQDWEKELESFKKAGFKTLVIQWLKLDSIRFFPSNTPTIDPIAIILSFADKNNMKVFLGLNFDSDWWNGSTDSVYLKGKHTKLIEFTEVVWNKYKNYASFQGWYIPYELGDKDYDYKEIQNIREFLRSVSREIKRLSFGKKKVAVSVFYTHRLTPEQIKFVFYQLFKDTRVDILIAQDGVGAQNWDTTVSKSTLPYLKAFQDVSHRTSTKFWIAVESFTDKKDTKTRSPTFYQRLKQQIAVAAQLTDTVITFDVFHYMSPSRGEPQTQLYSDYLKCHINHSCP